MTFDEAVPAMPVSLPGPSPYRGADKLGRRPFVE